MQLFNTPIPLSLYIHIPWCVRKCPYCDFNSHAAQTLPEEEYITALLTNLDRQLPVIWGRRIVSIFFGGGTPSLFKPKAIEKILNAIHQRLHFGPQIEITLEANPGTVDQAHFKGFREAGINRLSIGIQSLQDEKLKALGRIHDREYALRAIDAAIASGFTNFNLDLMHGLPNQSITDGLDDLQDALQFQPPHLSWYQLTIEPNTLFYRHPPALPEEDILHTIQYQGKELLTERKLIQYEISAFAKADHQCVHNQNYWEFGDYLGIGAGAHSKITDREQQVIKRWFEAKHPKEYLNNYLGLSTLPAETILSEKDARFEFMLNALRLTGGVTKQLFSERTGLTLHQLEPFLTLAQNKKLMQVDPDRLQPTELGLRFLNDLMGLFLEN